MLMLIMPPLTGCSSLLPSSRQDVKASWDGFGDVKTAFDRIVPYATTTEDLKDLGFDPFAASNIELLTYMDIVKRFMPNPNIKKEELDRGLIECLAQKESCRAYEIKLKKVEKERYGNVFLDLFGFKRQTRVSGWEFNAIVVLKSDLVVYKIWGGKPRVAEFHEEKKPLGPLQEIGNVVEQVISL